MREADAGTVHQARLAREQSDRLACPKWLALRIEKERLV